jgi:hypothetical protein
MNEEEQMNRWQQHFEEILNRKTNQYIREISDQSGEQNLKLKINTEIPTLNEIKMALKQTKNGRASGVDNINPEILTANIDTTASVLLPLFGKIWRQEKILQDWKCGLIVKIPKKGDRTNNKCSNWRGISVPGKVFTRVTLNRVKAVIVSHLRK